MRVPETMNLHVWPKCNLSCVYCYGTFPARPESLPLSGWCGIIDDFAGEGGRRVTFSGGEPTFHPDLEGMLRHTRGRGLQTSIITNGARLTEAHASLLDLVGVTVDAAREEVLVRIGRTGPRERPYLDVMREVAARVHRGGGRLKINTVVTTVNADEDLTELLLELQPSKWKPLQFVTVPGENDAHADSLRVSDHAFRAFVTRHHRVAAAGIVVAPESEEVVRKTYLMVDPEGRVFQHGASGHVLSEPVLAVGLRRALAQAGGYDRQMFEARGGHVDIRRLPLAPSGRAR